MIKLEEGKYYRTGAGKKVGPMMPSLNADWPWIVALGDGLCWHNDGSPVEGTESPLLVAEWVDGVPLKVEKENPKIWRDMTPEEKGALLLAHHEGKVIECCAPNEKWFPIEAPSWVSHFAYRVRPEPKRETIVLYDQCATIWTDHNPCDAEYRITFDIVDGEPDCGSIKMEKL